MKKKKNILKEKIKLFLLLVALYVLIGICGYSIVDGGYSTYINAEKEVKLYEEYKTCFNMSFVDYQNYKYYKNLLEKNDKNELLIRKQELKKYYILFMVLLFLIIIFLITRI